MPLFSSASPNPELEAEIVRVTSELQTELKWDTVLSLCDKLSSIGSKASADCVKILQKRLNNTNPHVVLLTIELTDALMKNAGITFQKEACNLSFIKELKAVASCSKTRVAEEMRRKVKEWAEHECKEDPALNLMPTLYYELRGEGYEFPAHIQVKKSQPVNPNPDYVSSKEEEDQIAAAIQASLNENSKSETTSRKAGSGSVASSSHLYPTNSIHQTNGGKERRMVKALYDFEAAEDNELTFKAGDTITLTDDSDMNWWKGYTSGEGEGLFPASFVTSDLSANVESETASSSRKVQFDENIQVKEVEGTPQIVLVDEEKLNKCLELLEDADPTGDRPDPPELEQLEAECLSMGPLIDAHLADIDGQHNTLAEVDVKIREALVLYDAAMNQASAQFRAQHCQVQPQPGGPPQMQSNHIPQVYQQGYPNGNEMYPAQTYGVVSPVNQPPSDPSTYNYPPNSMPQQYVHYSSD